MTGREFLIANEKKRSDMGCTAICCLSRPRTEAGKSRDLALIRAFLQMLSDASAISKQQGASKKRRNVTYLL